MIADPDIRSFFEALKQRIADVEAIVTDNGMTVGVRRPTMPPSDALYIAREYKAERDGRVGYYILTLNSLEEMVRMLQPQ